MISTRGSLWARRMPTRPGRADQLPSLVSILVAADRIEFKDFVAALDLKPESEREHLFVVILIENDQSLVAVLRIMFDHIKRPELPPICRAFRARRLV